MGSEKKWIIAITGASGIPYSLNLINFLEKQNVEQHIIISEAAFRVFSDEANISLSPAKVLAKSLIGRESSSIFFHNYKDIGSSLASGTFKTNGMVIVPCTMNTLGAVANGLGNNLIHRAADVTLKEARRLIVVPRETPLNQIHLENMLKLSRAGAIIAPTMPAFYHLPKTVEDIVNMMVMKILDLMDIDSSLVSRWGEKRES